MNVFVLKTLLALSHTTGKMGVSPRAPDHHHGGPCVDEATRDEFEMLVRVGERLAGLRAEHKRGHEPSTCLVGA